MRRDFSSRFARWFGYSLVACGVAVFIVASLIRWHIVCESFFRYFEVAVDAMSCFIFGWVLIRWAGNIDEPGDGATKADWQEFHNGLGSETVVLVVAVITGVVTIMSLMYIAGDAKH